LSELLPEHGLTRADIFITSKLAPKDQGADKARTACQKILDDCTVAGEARVDLVLIHWPGTAKVKHEDALNSKNRAETWQILTEYYERGDFTNIGVSNYLLTHLKDISQNQYHPSTLKPSVVQNEFHPLYQDEQVIQYCRDNNIQFQGYSPFGQGALWKNEKIAQACKDHKIAQNHALILYNLQKSIAVIPMSTNLERMAANFNLPVGSEHTDIGFLESIDEENRGKLAWDPVTIR